jgi:hypothetical protein
MDTRQQQNQKGHPLMAYSIALEEMALGACVVLAILLLGLVDRAL